VTLLISVFASRNAVRNARIFFALVVSSSHSAFPSLFVFPQDVNHWDVFLRGFLLHIIILI